VLLLATPRHHQRGQLLVLFALVPPVLLGALGLAIEVGFALAQRQRMQAASDLAALNGAYLHGESEPIDMRERRVIPGLERQRSERYGAGNRQGRRV
jgi:hypothetical protein